MLAAVAARPAARLRRALPDPARDLGRRGARDPPQLRTRGDQVALLLADQRMPVMAGTDFLVQARAIVPDAKRVLLTAYADTTPAIAAINEVALDYYLLKPWDPPEERLFPVLEDLLTTWEAGAALETGGLRIIGHRFSKDSHDLRDFVARNGDSGALARRRARRRGAGAAPGDRRRRDAPAGRGARGRRGARAADRAGARRSASA